MKKSEKYILLTYAAKKRLLRVKTRPLPLYTPQPDPTFQVLWVSKTLQDWFHSTGRDSHASHYDVPLSSLATPYPQPHAAYKHAQTLPVPKTSPPVLEMQIFMPRPSESETFG